MTGIYKITSPSGRIYIGESININIRKNTYSKLRCKKQTRLYNSLLKYGWESHLFEIIEECLENELKCRERYWQDFYDVISKKGLNLKLTKCGEEKSVMSEDIKYKISLANKGTNNAMYGLKGELHPAFGGLKNGMKGRVHSNDTKLKMSKSRQNWNFSNESKNKFSENSKNGNNPNAKKVINTENNIVYDSAKEAAQELGHSIQVLRKKLNGEYKNNTNLKYLKHD